ncbi:MAG TPA: hypothetical protein V6D26_05995 [Stenomitos sp.]
MPSLRAAAPMVVLYPCGKGRNYHLDHCALGDRSQLKSSIVPDIVRAAPN